MVVGDEVESSKDVSAAHATAMVVVQHEELAMVGGRSGAPTGRGVPIPSPWSKMATTGRHRFRPGGRHRRRRQTAGTRNRTGEGYGSAVLNGGRAGINESERLLVRQAPGGGVRELTSKYTWLTVACRGS